MIVNTVTILLSLLPRHWVVSVWPRVDVENIVFTLDHCFDPKVFQNFLGLRNTWALCGESGTLSQSP